MHTCHWHYLLWVYHFQNQAPVSWFIILTQLSSECTMRFYCHSLDTWCWHQREPREQRSSLKWQKIIHVISISGIFGMDPVKSLTQTPDIRGFSQSREAKSHLSLVLVQTACNWDKLTSKSPWYLTVIHIIASHLRNSQCFLRSL